MRYTLNVDSDEILYSSAFAVEVTAYKVTILGTDKQYDFGIKYNRKEIIEYLKQKGKFVKLDYEISTYKVPRGPKEYALACCKNVITSLGKLGEVKLWLTSDDKSNFRFRVANTKGPNGKGYKSGRPERPIYYQDCRDYLLQLGAEEISGFEADDALGMYQTETTIAVHQDKDINRIEGKHYNWKTGERYVVEQPGKIWLDDKRKLRGHGNAGFFAQMLSGDRVDNIPSCGKKGDVTVHSLLKDCKEEIDYFNIVKTHYMEHYKEGWQHALLEMADLLYIQGPERISGSWYMVGFDMSLSDYMTKERE